MGYYKNGKDWTEHQREFASFQTLEDFLATTKYFEPSLLDHGCSYSLFRTGVLPMWQHPVNKRGGKWSFALDMKECNLNQLKPGILDHAWKKSINVLSRRSIWYQW